MHDTRLVIHIGLHKTGTSSIQKFLHVNHEALLEKGVLYPHAGRQRNDNTKESTSHLFLAWSTVGRYAQKYDIEVSDEWWIALLDEIERVKPRSTVLSSEFFWRATDEEIQRIQSHTKRHATEIVLYVRNPLDLAISLYKQGVKTGEISSDLSDHFMSRLWAYDYESTVRRWEKAFGRELVNIHIYEKAKRNLLRHFAKAAGINWSCNFVIPPRTNISPSDSTIHVMRWMNQLEEQFGLPKLKWFIHRARRNLLGGRFPGRWLAFLADKCIHQAIATQDDIERFRNETEEMTDRFVEKRVQGEDRGYFVC